MIHAFDSHELDTDRVELRRNGEAIPVEPQVFALLKLLVENPGRMIPKDEIFAQVWSGRFVSDSAIASRIKSARQALGDDGRTQRYIKTVHGLGIRFMAEVGAPATTIRILPAEAMPEIAERPSTRPGIAVLPFRLVGDGGPHEVIADALPYEVITQLSRLRWLHVIARGSSFQFREATDIAAVGARLGVRYCLSGLVELMGKSLRVSVELSDARDNGVMWSERFESHIDAVHEIREEIVRTTVGALELEIPLNEARDAQLKSPQHLDAWSAYHLAAQRMYRFTREDNAAATALLRRAIELEPDFARAHAGLSFTAFQDAFLHYADDIPAAVAEARRHAEQALVHDPLDPFCNFTMGRSFILQGDVEGSLPWIGRANLINPNFAQGKYSMAWADALLDRGADAQANADAAMSLSPLDPLRYAMLAVRAFSHVVRDQPAEAAHWADQAARSPGAHVLIDLIAVAAHSFNGDMERAQSWANIARARAPDACRAAFFQAFPYRDPVTRKRFSDGLERFGF